MDLETAEIIIFQYYLQPCCSAKAEAVISRTLLLQRGVQLTGWYGGQMTLWLLLLLSEPQGPWQCQVPA